MSATADVDALSEFFAAGVDEKEANDSDTAEIVEAESQGSWSGLSDTEQVEETPMRTRIVDSAAKSHRSNHDRIARCYIEGRQYPIQTTYFSEATQDFTEAALSTIFQIHAKEPLPGDVLVFLPGQDTIEALEGMVNEHASAMDAKMPKVYLAYYSLGC